MIAVMRSHFPDDEFRENSQNIRLAHFVAEAHVFSFAQSLHSMSDILAKVILYGKLYGEKTISEFVRDDHKHIVENYLKI